MIPYGHQDITDEDVAAVSAVLRSDFLTQGPVVPRFEEAVASVVGAKHAVAASSATSALYLACRALDLAPGDILWTSAITFVASANCGRHCGASVDFVDIDEATYNIDVGKLAEKLANARARGTLPKVLVTVHMAGQPTDQEAIASLANEYGFRVIEDAAHSLGGSRNGEPVGSCRWSDITVFSFHPVKVITTGEGGMAVTNDDALARRMRLLRNHGVTKEANVLTDANNARYGFQEQIDLGWNFRLTDIQAALGLSQLPRLQWAVERRGAIAQQYAGILEGLPLTLPVVGAGNRSAFHLYVVRLVNERRLNLEVIAELRKLGVGAQLHYPALHLQPYYRALGFSEGMFPVAERYARTALTLPLFAAITDDQLHQVRTALQKVLS